MTLFRFNRLLCYSKFKYYKAREIIEKEKKMNVFFSVFLGLADGLQKSKHKTKHEINCALPTILI